jgi:hypothetical protein
MWDYTGGRVVETFDFTVFFDDDGLRVVPEKAFEFIRQGLGSFLRLISI